MEKMSAAKPPCCGVARFLTLLDGPWATLVVRELLHGPRRFTELRSALPGISAHTLTHRLRGFERHGLVTRMAFAETPPRVVYELTPLGEGLRDVLEAMRKWGDAVPDAVIEPPQEPPMDATQALAAMACPFGGDGANRSEQGMPGLRSDRRPPRQVHDGQAADGHRPIDPLIQPDGGEQHAEDRDQSDVGRGRPGAQR